MPTIKVPIEVDITYVNRKWGFAQKKIDRHYIIGFYQRNGVVIIEAIPDDSHDTIVNSVLKNVTKGCTLFCEKNMLPSVLAESYKIIELNAGQKTNGEVHVNHLKNVWKDLKRQIKEVHISVDRKYIQAYCDSVAWHVNNRDLSPGDRFDLAIRSSVVGTKK